MTIAQAEPRPRRLTFEGFWNIVSPIRFETDCIKFFVKRVMNHLESQGYAYAPTTIVGSARVRENFADHFYHTCKWQTREDAEKLLRSSDVDIAGEFDDFLLEELQSRVPELVEKQAVNEDGEYQTGVLLRSVHECTFGDLVKGFPNHIYVDAVKEAAAYHFLAEVPDLKALDNTVVQLLSVRKTSLVETIWGNLDANFFVKNLWKKSPSYLGKEYVRQFFNHLEKVAWKSSPYAKVDKIYTTTGNLVAGVVPDWGAPVAGQWVVVDELEAQPGDVVGVAI